MARNSSGTVRDFYYKEGAWVKSEKFAGGPGSGWPGWGGSDYGLRIVSARWGSGAQIVNVADRLQGMVRNNRLSVRVNPETMGGDPVPNIPKMLSVIYDWHGKRRSKVVAEGRTLNLP